MTESFKYREQAPLSLQYIVNCAIQMVFGRAEDHQLLLELDNPLRKPNLDDETTATPLRRPAS